MFLKNKKVIVFLAIFIFPNFLHAQYNTMTSDLDVNLTVTGCNNNSICEANLEENSLNCPLDCVIQTETDESRKKTGTRVRFETVKTNIYPEINSVKAVIENKNVYLFWGNPTIENFNFVRIVRNKEYSENPYDGEIVYEGNLDNFRDNIADFNKDYFYNFFARYKDGSFSKGVGLVVNSPALSIAEDVDSEVKDLEFEELEQEPVIFSDKFSIYDLIFIQDKEKLRWKKGELSTDSRNKIEIFYPKKDFFGEVEDVYLNLSYYDDEKKFFKKEVIKLNYSSVEQAYFTQVSDIQNISKIEFRFSIFGKNREEFFVQSSLNFEEKTSETSKKDDKFFLIIFILIVLILVLFFKPKKRDN